MRCYVAAWVSMVAACKVSQITVVRPPGLVDAVVTRRVLGAAAAELGVAVWASKVGA